MNSSSEQRSGIFLTDEFMQNSVIHTNLSQEVIITTADKLKLSLMEHEKYTKTKTDWIPPVSIFLSSITVLVAADFKGFAGISADTWNSIFIIISLSSAVWSAITIYRAIRYREKGDFNKLIEKIKNQSLHSEITDRSA